MNPLWAIRAAQSARKAKRFWKMLSDPKKKQRWIDKVNQIKNKNKLKTSKQKTFDFNDGGEVVIGKNVDRDLL